MPCYGRATIRAWSRRTVWWAFCQSMADQSITPWKDAPAGWFSAVICFSSLVVFSSVLVMKDQAEVCPLSRGVILPSLFPPLQKDICFFRHLLPAVPLVHLTATYRLLGGHRAYRVPLRYQGGLGPLYSPVALGVHERAVRRASPRHSAFWLKPVSILGLLWVTTFIKRSHRLTMPLNPSLRSALMLADPDAASRFCQ